MKNCELSICDEFVLFSMIVNVNFLFCFCMIRTTKHDEQFETEQLDFRHQLKKKV